MSRRDVKLITSLSNYVRDVKPFHTKLKEFLSELTVQPDTLFNPRINVSIQDSVTFADVTLLVPTGLGYDVGGFDVPPYDTLPP